MNDLSKSKVLVTGAGGFVGAELVKHLVNSNYHVKGLVRNSKQAELVSQVGAEPIIGDLLDIDSLREAAKGTSQIYHIAALFRQAGLPDAEFFRVNVDGTKNILDVALEARINKFIHCSTVGVHGNIENPPGRENTPFAPGDPYQSSKLEGELLVDQYLKMGKISGSIIRPAMIYGERDTRTLKLFKTISKNNFFYVGKGDALVHFVDVKDLARAFRLAAETPEANGETFIIAGKTSLRLNELVSIIATLFGVREPWLHLPVKPMQTIGSICEAICTPLRLNPPIYRRRVDFFTKNRNFDSSKAREILNFHPEKILVEELINIIDSYIQAEMIPKTALRPASILRCIDGRIMKINSEAERLYGLCQKSNIGKITHEVFETQFPDKLENINQKVSKFGRWKGVLQHTVKDKQAIQVESKWLMVPNCDPNKKMILEVNLPKKDKRTSIKSNAICFLHPELLEMLAI